MSASDLRVPFSGKPKNFATASMVPIPGVSTLVSVPSPTLGHNDLGTCGLVIGSKAALVAVDERGLTGVGQSHVLDGGVATDLAGVGDNGEP